MGVGCQGSGVGLGCIIFVDYKALQAANLLRAPIFSARSKQTGKSPECYNDSVKNFSSRLPAVNDLLSVSALIVFFVYSWSLIIFFWNFPRFILFLTLREIAAIGAYSFSIALADSVLIVSLTLIAAGALPARWIRSDFVPRGGVIGMGIFGASIFLQSVSGNLYRMDDLRIALLCVLLIVLIGLLAYVAARAVWLASALTKLAQTSEIFFYLYIPISVLSVFVVLIRNLIGQ